MDTLRRIRLKVEIAHPRQAVQKKPKAETEQPTPEPAVVGAWTARKDAKSRLSSIKGRNRLLIAPKTHTAEIARPGELSKKEDFRNEQIAGAELVVRVVGCLKSASRRK